MSALTDLIHRVEHRAEADPEAVLPVLRLLADPDQDPVDDGVVHRTALQVNASRVAKLEREFRAGAVGTTEVRQIVGVSRQAVNERVRAGSLLAAKIGARLVYPRWQFTSTGFAPALSEIVSALTEVTGGDVRQADAIMRAAQPDLAGHPSLADLLAAGATDEIVQRIVARSDQS